MEEGASDREVEEESTATSKKHEGRHVQFSLENNQTFEFDKMEGVTAENSDVCENGLTDEDSGEDIDELRKKQREEIRKLNRQLVQFKQQCKKEMETFTSNMDKKKEDLEKEIECLRNKKDVFSEMPEGNGTGLTNSKIGDMVVQLKDKEKELAKKAKKIQKYEKKIESLEEKITNLKTAHNTESLLNSRNSGEFVERTEAQCQTETDILLEYELTEIKKNTEFLERKQKLLDEEQQLLEREDELSRRQQSLSEYEKEIEEVEGYLNRRQSMVSRQQDDLMELNKELGLLRSELESEKEEMKKQGVDVNSSKEKAKMNWEFLRRGLVDKQSVAERQLRTCRTQLAQMEVTLGTKENKIAILNEEMTALRRETEKKDKHIKQLESHLEVTLEESKRLENSLENNNMNDSNFLPRRSSSVSGSSSRIPSEFTVFVPSSKKGKLTFAENVSPAGSPTHRQKFVDMTPIAESESSSSTENDRRLSRSYSGISTAAMGRGINKKRPTSLKTQREMSKQRLYTTPQRSLSETRRESIKFDYETPKSATCSVM